MSEGIDEADRPQALEGAGTDLLSKFDPLIELGEQVGPRALKHLRTVGFVDTFAHGFSLAI